MAHGHDGCDAGSGRGRPVLICVGHCPLRALLLKPGPADGDQRNMGGRGGECVGHKQGLV